MSQYAIADTESGTVIDIQDANIHVIPWPVTASGQEQINSDPDALRYWVSDQGVAITPEIAGEMTRPIPAPAASADHEAFLNATESSNGRSAVLARMKSIVDDEAEASLERAFASEPKGPVHIRDTALVDDWKHEVQNGDTWLGFDEWLQHQIDAAL